MGWEATFRSGSIRPQPAELVGSGSASAAPGWRSLDVCGWGRCSVTDRNWKVAAPDCAGEEVGWRHNPQCHPAGLLRRRAACDIRLNLFHGDVTLEHMDDLHRLADELHETFSERGYAIEKALSTDKAFRRTRRSQSSLVRDLVLEGVEAATTKIGLGYIPVVGGSCDVQAIIDDVDRRFRVLKAGVDSETCDYEIVASSDAIMTITEAEPDALFPTQRWVLGYTVDDQGILDHIFAARVHGLSDHSVPRLTLGQVTELGSQFTSPPPSDGFHPVDEDDLDGMEDDAEEDGEEGGITGA